MVKIDVVRAHIRCSQFTNLFIPALSFLSMHSLSDAQRKQEECATNIEKFLSLIQIISEHKAEVSTKVETLTIEKSTMEQEKEDCVKKIEQLKETINGQELSQEDVRRMEREKARIEEQISKHKNLLDEHVAALKEATEKWIAVYQLLEERASEYKRKARHLELIPKNAKHAKGVTLDVLLDKSKSAEGETELLGGIDIGRTVNEHVSKIVQECEDAMDKDQMQIKDTNCQILSAENSFVKLIQDIEVRFYLLVPDPTFHLSLFL